MAVQRLKTCDNIVELSQELGVHRRLLYKWRDQFDPFDPGEESPPRNSRASTRRQEIDQLKRVLVDKTLELWLAFEPDDFRLAGVLCNTVNREHSEDSVGKGDWFPLIDPTKRASLASRSYADESPVLLDPVGPFEPYDLTFNDDGKPAPASHLEEIAEERIRLSIRYLGLDQSLLNGARRNTWRDCVRKIVKYGRVARKSCPHPQRFLARRGIRPQ
jgi:hypothetical protein